MKIKRFNESLNNPNEIPKKFSEINYIKKDNDILISKKELIILLNIFHNNVLDIIEKTKIKKDSYSEMFNIGSSKTIELILQKIDMIGGKTKNELDPYGEDDWF